MPTILPQHTIDISVYHEQLVISQLVTPINKIFYKKSVQKDITFTFSFSIRLQQWS